MTDPTPEQILDKDHVSIEDDVYERGVMVRCVRPRTGAEHLAALEAAGYEVVDSRRLAALVDVADTAAALYYQPLEMALDELRENQ